MELWDYRIGTMGHDRAMGLWNYGTVVVWDYETAGLWSMDYGTMGLWPWYGTIAMRLWGYGTMGLWTT